MKGLRRAVMPLVVGVLCVGTLVGCLSSAQTRPLTADEEERCLADVQRIASPKLYSSFIAAIAASHGSLQTKVAAMPLDDANCHDQKQIVALFENEWDAKHALSSIHGTYVENAGDRIILREWSRQPLRSLCKLAQSATSLDAPLVLFPDSSGGVDPEQTSKPRFWQAIQRPSSEELRHLGPGLVVAILGDGVVDPGDLPEVVHLAAKSTTSAGTRCEGGTCCGTGANSSGGHDTKVAGLIAAKEGSGSGVGNVSKILAISAYDSWASVTAPHMAGALLCAVEKDADVIAISHNSCLTTNTIPPDLKGALLAVEQHAMISGKPLLIISAANQGADLARDKHVWPGSFVIKNSITVEARKYDGTGGPKSNYGEGVVRLAAPTDSDEMSCLMSSPSAPRPSGDKFTGRSESLGGTSAAAAIVAGGATLVWSDWRYKACPATEIKNTLIQRGKKNIGSPNTTVSAPMLNLGFLTSDCSSRLSDGRQKCCQP